jgi:arylsulfatase A-like enzyme
MTLGRTMTRSKTMRNDRTPFVRWTCAAAAAWIGLASAVFAQNAANPRPNIILMMADDMGYGDPHYMGNQEIQTDNLDAMASSGLRFNRFYAGAPSCSPTRGSCMTGRHPYRYGIWSANAGHMPPEEITLAELLKERGYTTAHFGKWHLGTLTKTVVESNRGGPRGADHYSPPWVNGFDYCFSTEAKVPTFDPMLKPSPDAGRLGWNPVPDPAEAFPYNTHYWTNGRKITDNLRGDDSRVIMDRVIPFIRKAHKADNPFFAVVWFHTPHLPTVAGKEHRDLYKQYDNEKQRFYGCITAMDQQIGRLRAELRRLGVAQNTMVWFCADNGPEGVERPDCAEGHEHGDRQYKPPKKKTRRGKLSGCAGPLRGRKRYVFEGGVRVPGILEWPAAIPQGRVTEVPASTSDYLPTVLDVLGLSMPDDRPLEGVSLKPLIEGRMRRRPKPIPFEVLGRLALVDNRYKIVYDAYVNGGPRPRQGKADPFPIERVMLFDLIDDPSEQHDLADEQPERVRDMVAELNRIRASWQASMAGADYPQAGSMPR